MKGFIPLLVSASNTWLIIKYGTITVKNSQVNVVYEGFHHSISFSLQSILYHPTPHHIIQVHKIMNTCFTVTAYWYVSISAICWIIHISWQEWQNWFQFPNSKNECSLIKSHIELDTKYVSHLGLLSNELRFRALKCNKMAPGSLYCKLKLILTILQEW